MLKKITNLIHRRCIIESNLLQGSIEINRIKIQELNEKVAKLESENANLLLANKKLTEQNRNLSENIVESRKPKKKFNPIDLQDGD